MANSDPTGGGRNKQISENEEEIRVFYCLALKKRGINKEKVGEEISNFMASKH